MSRYINIDNLIFNILYLGRYSCIIIKIDNKKDKEGKKTFPNNFYTDLFDLFICLFDATFSFVCVND